MAERKQWSGTASDFLRAADSIQRDEVSILRPDWPRTPRALAGRLRRAQTSLRAVGIDVAFHRERHAGSQIIRMRMVHADDLKHVREHALLRAGAPERTDMS